eukprot:753350-Hanusia_phi.AAC.2
MIKSVSQTSRLQTCLLSKINQNVFVLMSMTADGSVRKMIASQIWNRSSKQARLSKQSMRLNEEGDKMIDWEARVEIGSASRVKVETYRLSFAFFKTSRSAQNCFHLTRLELEMSLIRSQDTLSWRIRPEHLFQAQSALAETVKSGTIEAEMLLVEIVD